MSVIKYSMREAAQFVVVQQSVIYFTIFIVKQLKFSQTQKKYATEIHFNLIG